MEQEQGPEAASAGGGQQQQQDEQQHHEEAGQPNAATAKTPASGGKAKRLPTCQVCGEDLSEKRVFFRRYHICEDHMASPEVQRDGVLSRFCQQCGRFHALSAFDGTQRSCREQLANHNSRRRFRRSHAASSDREEWDGDSEALLDGYVPRATTKRLRSKCEREAAEAAVQQKQTAQRHDAAVVVAQAQGQATRQGPAQQQQQHVQVQQAPRSRPLVVQSQPVHQVHQAQADWPQMAQQAQQAADWPQLAWHYQAGLLLQQAAQQAQQQQAASVSQQVVAAAQQLAAAAASQQRQQLAAAAASQQQQQQQLAAGTASEQQQLAAGAASQQQQQQASQQQRQQQAPQQERQPWAPPQVLPPVDHPKAQPLTESGGSSSMNTLVAAQSHHPAARAGAAAEAAAAANAAAALVAVSEEPRQLSSTHPSGLLEAAGAPAKAAGKGGLPQGGGLPPWGRKRQRHHPGDSGEGGPPGSASLDAPTAPGGSSMLEHHASQPTRPGALAFHLSGPEGKPINRSGEVGGAAAPPPVAAPPVCASPGRVERTLLLPAAPAGAAHGIAAYQQLGSAAQTARGLASLQRPSHAAQASLAALQGGPAAAHGQAAMQNSSMAQQEGLAALLQQASPNFATAAVAAAASTQQEQQAQQQQQQQQQPNSMWVPPLSSSLVSAYSQLGLSFNSMLSQHLPSAALSGGAGGPQPSLQLPSTAAVAASLAHNPNAGQLASLLRSLQQGSQHGGQAQQHHLQQQQQDPGSVLAAALRHLEQQRAAAAASVSDQHLARLLAALQHPPLATAPSLPPALSVPTPQYLFSTFSAPSLPTVQSMPASLLQRLHQLSGHPSPHNQYQQQQQQYQQQQQQHQEEQQQMLLALAPLLSGLLQQQAQQQHQGGDGPQSSAYGFHSRQ